MCDFGVPAVPVQRGPYTLPNSTRLPLDDERPPKDAEDNTPRIDPWGMHTSVCSPSIG